MPIISFIPLLAEAAVILPAWATALISIIVSTIITGILSYVIKRSLDRYFKKRDAEALEEKKKLQDLEKLQNESSRQQRKNDMVEVVKAELEPVTTKLDSLMGKVSKIEEGTLSCLRHDILNCYYKCCKKGYRGDWDFENIHHLFDAYKDLNGNSFVRDVIERFDELPSKEEYSKQKANGHKNSKKLISSSADEDLEDFIELEDDD